MAFFAGLAALTESSMTTEGMTSAVSSIMQIVSTVVSTIAGNPILMIFFCSGLVGIAIGIVRRLKR